MIIVDTNIIAGLYIDNPHVAEVEALLVASPNWFAPELWRSEFRNVLIQYVRHSRIALMDALQIMDYAEELIGLVEVYPPSVQILRLADTSGCSAYDCEFVALARALGTVLITFDRKLRAAFPTIAMTPSAFLALSG